ncbi:MAG: hypothetical protein HUU54_11215 [Ignavibacteriaceae bacterium]|nr:hypothetical protein [Ignavibacteriaceae bacterium]
MNIRGKILYGLFFLFAGAYHFINPGFYIPLIPDYFPLKELINYASGAAEIIAGLLLLTNKYSRYGGRLVLVIMILFIPSHVYFIQIGSCVESGLCVPAWVAWVRLVIIHPLLMCYGWKLSSVNNNLFFNKK